MARSDRAFLLILCLVVAVSCVPISYCSKKPVGVARKEDIPYIKCGVCKILAYQLHQQVQNKQAQISPKKISEYEIIGISENVCNLKKHEADWILKIDIVEQGDRLELVEQDSEGQCNSECRTIERACQEVIGYSDTDVAEYLYKKKPLIDSLVNFLCNDITEACSSKPPPVPKGRTPGKPFVPKSQKEAEMEKMLKVQKIMMGRTPGEPFVPKSQKEAEMEKTLKSMEGMPGAPGMKMYSREDLMNNMQNFGNEDADEDDDDAEEHFPSKLGKVLRERESNKDWKQKIIKGIQDTSEALKQHASKVSHRVRQWWRGKKAGFKKSSKAEL